MKRKNKKSLWIGICVIGAFVLWTLLVRLVDVRMIGPRASRVGFATLNGAIHDFFGVHMWLYNITDWLGLVPIAAALSFAILGLVQWIKRKKLCKVDVSILALGVFYIAVISVYLFFEAVVINYRPKLIDGHLEASYPSSTTMLTMCVMPTAAMQLNARIKNSTVRRSVVLGIGVFTASIVIGRLVSGVHWVTDIIGGALFSLGIVLMYKAFAGFEVK